jgi:hypothetical protein
MPFDPANVRILPPMLKDVGLTLDPFPPERGGGDPRRQVRITIEGHVPAPPTRRRSSALWWWVTALTVLALAAHAQPTEWHSYPFGNGTNYSGTDARGGQWTGRSFDFTGPDGRHLHCQSYTQDFDTITHCWPDRQ